MYPVIGENTLASHPVTASFIFLIRFWLETHIFQFSFDEILAICWPILMQDTVLER
jgi:hypothetical protein